MNIPEVKKEPKYLILGALSIVIQELIPSFVGKIQLEDLFKTIKLEDNITDQAILNEKEKYYIRKHKPLINAVKYDKSLKTNAELKNKYTIEIQEHQAKIDKLQQEITILKSCNQPLLENQIKEKESTKNKYIVSQNKLKSKRNAVPEEEYKDIQSTFTQVDTESVNLADLPVELTQDCTNLPQTTEMQNTHQMTTNPQNIEPDQQPVELLMFKCANFDICNKKFNTKGGCTRHQNKCRVSQ